MKYTVDTEAQKKTIHGTVNIKDCQLLYDKLEEVYHDIATWELEIIKTPGNNFAAFPAGMTTNNVEAAKQHQYGDPMPYKIAKYDTKPQANE